jgi:anti-repressor protein
LDIDHGRQEYLSPFMFEYYCESEEYRVEEVKIFTYGKLKLRTVLRNGEAWFVAKDVCEILKLSDVSKAVARLGERMKGTSSIRTLGGNQTLLIVNEPGVYKLVFTSRKPEAEQFTDWLAIEVLPTIRRYGAYISPEKLDDYLNNPELLSNLAKAIRSERQKRDVLEKQLALIQPKVAFADAVANCKDAIPVGDMAKLICQSGYYIGRNAFFAYLRDNGWLIRQNCHSWNLPTQKGIERGLFIIIETFRDVRKTDVLHRTSMITGKGQVFFMGLFLKKLARDLPSGKKGSRKTCRV